MVDPADPVALHGLRIFISYPRGGHAHTWAERVHADLQARGADPWRDEVGIQEGKVSCYDQLRHYLQLA